MEYRQDIQILRGIAVLFVLFYHLQASGFDNGFLGVDVFFVISGYLMAKLYDRGTTLEFYKRRFDRLYAAYAATVLVTLLIGLWRFIPPDFGQVFWQSIYSIFFSSNFYFWNQNSYFSNSNFNPLLNLWSLGVEVQFYFIVPFLYPLLKNRAFITLLVIILSLCACMVMQHISSKTSFFLMPFRIWEFLIGAAVAWFFDYKNFGGLKADFGRLLILTALIAMIFMAPLTPEENSFLVGHPGIYALITCVLTGALIAFGLPTLFIKSIVGRVVSIIGNYSYSIYLVHFPVISIINYQHFGGTDLKLSGWQETTFAIFLIIFLSVVLFQFVEKRGVKIINTPLKRVVLVVFITLFACITLSLNKNNYTRQEKLIFAALNDRSEYRCGKLFRILNPQKKICVIGNKDFQSKILLVGDSHADAIKSSFVQAANAENMSVYFYVSNDPLLDPAISAQKIIEDALEYEVVGIFSHFNVNQYKEKNFKEELIRLAELSQKEKIPHTIIFPVPTYTSNVPKSLFENRDKDLDLNILRKSKSNNVTDSADFRNLSKALSKLGTDILDPTLTFCSDKDNCLLSDRDGRPLYFDSHHLTLTGAKMLEPEFKLKMRQIN